MISFSVFNDRRKGLTRLHMFRARLFSALLPAICPEANFDTMSSISWTSLIAPLDVSTLPTLTLVLQLVPLPLAVAVLVRLLRAEHAQEPGEQAIANVVWKYSNYLLAMTAGEYSQAPLPSTLKNLHMRVPNVPVARVCSPLVMCHCCEHSKMIAQTPVSSSKIANNATTQVTADNYYKVYSLDAGLLFAEFVEKQCSSCRRCYLGNWSFRRPQGHFGHMIDLQCFALDAHGFFVMPKFRSLYAVEVSLLEYLTDTLTFCGGSIKGAVLVWARRHPQHASVLLGANHTLLPHTIDNLVTAWYTWRCLAMSQNFSTTWDFSSASFDSCLQSHLPIIRQEHIKKMARHIVACPRCCNDLCLVVDGKQGARRLICARCLLAY